MHSHAAQKNGQNNYGNASFLFLWLGARMASANENCCINELIFKKRSMLIECVIAHHTSRHQSAETTTGIAAMLRGTRVAFLTLLRGCTSGSAQTPLGLRTYLSGPVLQVMVPSSKFVTLLQSWFILRANDDGFKCFAWANPVIGLKCNCKIIVVK